MEKSKVKVKKPPKEKPFRTTIRLTDALHRAIKSEAALCGVSMKKWMTDLFEVQLDIRENEKIHSSPQQKKQAFKA